MQRACPGVYLSRFKLGAVDTVVARQGMGRADDRRTKRASEWPLWRKLGTEGECRLLGRELPFAPS